MSAIPGGTNQHSIGQEFSATRRSIWPFKSDKTMTTFQAGHVERGESVWVWDGSWLPATVADVVLERGRKCLIVPV
jgi:hypothetical protein